MRFAFNQHHIVIGQIHFFALQKFLQLRFSIFINDFWVDIGEFVLKQF